VNAGDNKDHFPKVKELSRENLSWLDNCRKIGYGLLRDSGLEHGYTLQDLDIVYEKWAIGNSHLSAEEATNAIGVLLGDYMIKDIGLSWMLITDDYGTDVGLYSQNWNIEVFPNNLLIKRYEDHEHDFVIPMYNAIKKWILDKWSAKLP